MKKIKISALTFTGRRSNNQDACLNLKLDEDTYFLAVADGMGGVHGGQVASKQILENAEKKLREIDWNNSSEDKLKEYISSVFNTSQQALRDKVKEMPELSGMGTTLVGMLIKDNKFVWGNIGDSRLYLLRDGFINQLTVDHTYVEDYKKTKGDDIPDNILEQYSHYLTRAIDGGADEAEIFPATEAFHEIKEGDVFLLCSDGLITNKANTDTEIFNNYLLGTKTIQSAAKNLVSYAYDNGSKDNITVVIAEFGDLARSNKKFKRFLYPPANYIFKKFSDTKLKKSLLFIILLLILAIIISLLIF